VSRKKCTARQVDRVVGQMYGGGAMLRTCLGNGIGGRCVHGGAQIIEGGATSRFMR
jgi:hypothetical protein